MNILSNPVHVSLGAYGRVPHEVAIAEAMKQAPVDPLLGKLSTRHLQLCPQNLGTLTHELAGVLRKIYPETQWRLHANVRVCRVDQVIELCDWPAHQNYFQQVAELSRALQAPVYSAHAGKRKQASVEDVIRYSLELTDMFGIPVAIEGHYPTPGNHWLFSDWHEYRQLLESQACYALDLSHLHILANQTGKVDECLLSELLACERCLEIHLSGNDGQRDQHHALDDFPWWWPFLAQANPSAVMFSEGRIYLPAH